MLVKFLLEVSFVDEFKFLLKQSSCFVAKPLVVFSLVVLCLKSESFALFYVPIDLGGTVGVGGIGEAALQLQVASLCYFPQILGCDILLLVGEVALAEARARNCKLWNSSFFAM